MKNPLKVINEEYNDTRMGATIYSYLAGYNDARAAVYVCQKQWFQSRTLRDRQVRRRL